MVYKNDGNLLNSSSVHQWSRQKFSSRKYFFPSLWLEFLSVYANVDRLKTNLRPFNSPIPCHKTIGTDSFCLHWAEEIKIAEIIKDTSNIFKTIGCSLTFLLLHKWSVVGKYENHVTCLSSQATFGERQTGNEWMTIKMAARSSSTSLKPTRILRITYKELSELAEKLEKENKKSPTKRADKSKLKEDDDLVSNEKEKSSSKTDAVKNADVSSKQKSRKSKSEERTPKKNKERASPKEEKVKEHKDKKKKSRKSSSGSKTKRKQETDGGEPDENSDQEADDVEEKDNLRDHIKNKAGKKAAKCKEDKELKTGNGDPIKRSIGNSVSEVAEKPRGILKLPQKLGLPTDHKVTEERIDNLSKTVGFEKKNRDDCGIVEKRSTEVYDPEYSRNLSAGQHGRANKSTKLLYDPKNPARKPALEKIAERKKVEGIASRLQMLNLDKNDDEPAGKTLTLFDLSEDKATEKLVSHQTNDMQSARDVKVEKKIRHLNRQKAQQLMKQAAKPETELRNLLSRDFLKSNTYSLIKAKSREIQDSYKAVITLDVSLAVQNDVDYSLWKNAFYQIIESLRKYIKSFEELSGNEVSFFEETEEVYTKLLEFVDCGLVFYKDMLEALQTTHKFDVENIVVHPHKVQHLGRTVSIHSDQS